MKTRYAWSWCSWRPAAKFKDQLVLVLGDVCECEFLETILTDAVLYPHPGTKVGMLVVVDLLAEPAPVIVYSAGHIPGRYCDYLDPVQVQLSAMMKAICGVIVRRHVHQLQTTEAV